MRPSFRRVPTWEYSAMEVADDVVASGAVTREEMNARIRGMREVNDDPTILVVLPRVWQVWGRRA